MRAFSLQFNVATAATANTWDTILSLKLAATVGHRARMRKLLVTGGGGAAQDVQVQARFVRSNNTIDASGGTDESGNIAKVDPYSLGTNIAVAQNKPTTEPTVMDTDEYGLGGTNSRGVLPHDWTGDPEGAPSWGPDEAMNLQVTPGEATATNLSVAIEWEEH